MAMETIRSKLLSTRIVFSVKKFKAALFLGAELRLAEQHAVEFCVVRSLGEKELLQRTGDEVVSDFFLPGPLLASLRYTRNH